ncbi:ABC transporter substrate-binding protein [Kushneria aurantia]|uniref:ABC transporter substrate-binding protein n=1 Tax=Kushneria aurantia TaxID=504092 RepID=A0ABV6G9N8_9GAMM|nr:ABC transporter substrate-binding protein [Kushneria aurantia]
MTAGYHRPAALLLAALIITATPSRADTRLHYHGDGNTRGDAAALVIAGVIEPAEIDPLLRAFHDRYPTIDITYQDVSRSYQAHQQWPPSIREGYIDLLMSSSMGNQYRLANEGYARPFDADTLNPNWPRNARWRNELVGLTREPLVMVYNRALRDIATPPRDHGELLTLLTQHREALDGRVVSYDPASSATGFMAMASDVARSPEAWSLFEAMGAANAEWRETTTSMLSGLADGRYLIGYNLIGSYARRAAALHPELVIQMPRDYALALQRLAMIPHSARHPQAAQRFLSFITSPDGQQVMARETTLSSPHAEGDAADDDALVPIRPGPALLTLTDPLQRASLVAQWRSLTQGETTESPRIPAINGNAVESRNR